MHKNCRKQQLIPTFLLNDICDIGGNTCISVFKIIFLRHKFYLLTSPGKLICYRNVCISSIEMFVFLPLNICNDCNFCLITKIRTAGYLLIFVACIDICLKKGFFIPMDKTVDTHTLVKCGHEGT